jgi:phosphomethylpyrimidine synthase
VADEAAALEQGMAEKAAQFRAEGASVYRRT